MREPQSSDSSLQHGSRRLAPGVLVMALLAVVLTASHAQAQSTPVTACGTVLNAPGDYQLTGNLGPCSGHGVAITSNDVHLDLKGFAISGMSSPGSCNFESPQHGIMVTGAAAGVHITNGTVSSFVDGVVASNARVSAMHVNSNCAFGILMSGSGGTVETSSGFITLVRSQSGKAIPVAKATVLINNQANRIKLVLGC